MIVKYEPTTFVEDGMTVFIPWNRTKNAPGYDRRGTGARCVVAVAAGRHARVVNKSLGVDRWYSIDDLYVHVVSS